MSYTPKITRLIICLCAIYTLVACQSKKPIIHPNYAEPVPEKFLGVNLDSKAAIAALFNPKHLEKGGVKTNAHHIINYDKETNSNIVLFFAFDPPKNINPYVNPRPKINTKFEFVRYHPLTHDIGYIETKHPLDPLHEQAEFIIKNYGKYIWESSYYLGIFEASSSKATKKILITEEDKFNEDLAKIAEFSQWTDNFDKTIISVTEYEHKLPIIKNEILEQSKRLASEIEDTSDSFLLETADFPIENLVFGEDKPRKHCLDLFEKDNAASETHIVCSVALVKHPQDAELQYIVGRTAISQQQYALSVYWNSRAYQQGDVRAANNAGVALIKAAKTVNIKDKEDKKSESFLWRHKLMEEGINWYNIALFKAHADKDNSTIINTAHNLGFTYFYDSEPTIAQDYHKSLGSFMVAASAGSALAINYLGLHYANGLGTDKNPEKAVEYFRKSSDLGDSNGSYNLANAYLSGVGVQINEEKGISFLKLAAQRGHQGAAQKLKEYKNAQVQREEKKKEKGFWEEYGKPALAIGGAALAYGIYKALEDDDKCFRPDKNCNSRQAAAHERLYDRLKNHIGNLSRSPRLQACRSHKGLVSAIKKLGLDIFQVGISTYNVTIDEGGIENIVVDIATLMNTIAEDGPC